MKSGTEDVPYGNPVGRRLLLLIQQVVVQGGAESPEHKFDVVRMHIAEPFTQHAVEFCPMNPYHPVRAAPVQHTLYLQFVRVRRRLYIVLVLLSTVQLLEKIHDQHTYTHTVRTYAHTYMHSQTDASQHPLPPPPPIFSEYYWQGTHMYVGLIPGVWRKSVGAAPAG